MKKRKTSGQYRVLAVVWTLAALSMLAAVVRQLPNVSSFGFAIFALSVAAAALWWSAYLRAMKEQKPVEPIKPIKPIKLKRNKDSEEKKHER